MSEYIPQPGGNTWQTWANSLNKYLAQIRSKLRQKTVDESASDDGLILWDRDKKYPVVSRDGEYVQIILEDGHADLGISTDVTAALVNTAYPLTFDTPTNAKGISLGTPASRIVFSEAGEYLLSFTAQIASSSSSTVNFWFWPRKNGVDVTGSTIKSALHQNNATTVVSRAALFTVEENDYVEAMWAVDSTSGYLNNALSTAFAPSTPAVTLSITRIHG